jgi:Holliday junction resolvasome RuvABC endonuclease subunit
MGGEMRIIGLDTATKTGWAIFDSASGKIIESGVQDFAKRRGESNGLMFLRFLKWLSQIIDTARPDLIAYERAHHRGGAATEICVNLTGRVQEAAADNGLECATVPTMTLKKWSTGRGNAGKPEMIAAARKLIGREPIDDNEADAVMIAAWAACEYCWEGK